jgi:hypothetical protein
LTCKWKKTTPSDNGDKAIIDTFDFIYNHTIP